MAGIILFPGNYNKSPQLTFGMTKIYVKIKNFAKVYIMSSINSKNKNDINMSSISKDEIKMELNPN